MGEDLFQKVNSLLFQEVKGGPRLPFEQRTASAFLHAPEYEEDDALEFTAAAKIGFLSLEVVKMLLMLGKLGPILQVCALRYEGLSGWYCVSSGKPGVCPVPI